MSRARARCIARGPPSTRPAADRLPEAHPALDDAVGATDEEEVTGPWPATGPCHPGSARPTDHHPGASGPHLAWLVLIGRGRLIELRPAGRRRGAQRDRDPSQFQDLKLGDLVPMVVGRRSARGPES
jgi:hypothetical protein